MPDRVIGTKTLADAAPPVCGISLLGPGSPMPSGISWLHIRGPSVNGPYQVSSTTGRHRGGNFRCETVTGFCQGRKAHTRNVVCRHLTATCGKGLTVTKAALQTGDDRLA